MNLIAVENGCFSYGEVPLFQAVSLTVAPGEICCLMGPNGCGKSTLLDCILGVQQLQVGSVEIAGEKIETYDRRAMAQQISYVPQTHHRTFPYTVEQVVLMGRTAHQKGCAGPSTEDRAIALDALRQTGIFHLAARPYTQISGGELQLVLLARALSQSAAAILMDEPTAHLDFRNELVFLETVAQLVQQQKIGVLMATHSPNQPFYFENQNIPTTVLAMERGTIARVGTPSAVLTEEAIHAIYQVDAKRLEYRGESGVHRQILPIRTQGGTKHETK